MDNESRATPLACCVTDFNVLPLGALIFLAAANPWRQSSLNSPTVGSQLYRRAGIIIHNKRLVGFVSQFRRAASRVRNRTAASQNNFRYFGGLIRCQSASSVSVKVRSSSCRMSLC